MKHQSSLIVKGRSNDFSSHEIGMRMWAGTIPVQDAEEAVKELRRIVPLGSVEVNLLQVRWNQIPPSRDETW